MRKREINHRFYLPSFVPIFGTCRAFLLDELMAPELSAMKNKFF